MEARHESGVRSLAGLNFLFGAWLVVSPYILNYAPGQERWEQTIAGIVVLLASAIRYFSPAQVWASWISMLAGLWMIIAPYATSYTTTAAYWNEVIFGILITLVGFSNAMQHMAGTDMRGTHTHHPAT